MNSLTRSTLVGTHAFLSPSSPAWVNYDDDKLTRVWYSNQEAKRGTEFHELAAKLIKLGVRLPKTSTTLNMYVNDGIGYMMDPEHLFYYSDNCYGHADCAGFRENLLRIHDLKTGINPTSMVQLEIYAALFCLEMGDGFKPSQIGIELRIYQNDEVKIHIPEPDAIFHIMDRIVTFDRLLIKLKREVSF